MKKLYLLLLIVLIVLPLIAENKLTVAVLDLKSEGVPGIITNAVSNIVRSEFVNIANFRVIERAQIEAIIEEQKMVLTGLIDEASAAKIGELTSAQKVVVGDINGIGDDLVITIRIVDVETGESEFSAREKTNMDKVEDAAVTIARDLAQKIVSGNKEYFTALSPSGYYLRNFIPGWGQFYADKNKQGLLVSSLFIGATVYSGISLVNYIKADTAYSDLEDEDQATFDKKFKDKEDATEMLNYSFMAIGAAYLIHWIDALVFARPDFSGPDENPAIAMNKKSKFYIQPELLGTNKNNFGITIGSTLRFK